MALFTTEVRTLLKGWSDSHDINTQINDGIPHVFDDTWVLNNDENTQRVKHKILRHYYMREIGYETPQLWILKLNTELSEIAPKYSLLYNAIEEVKLNPIGNVNVTETQTANASGTVNASGTTKGTNKSTNNQTSESQNTGSSTGNGNSDSWQTSNDTPQGALDGIESNRYLSSAVHNKSATNQETTNQARTNASGTTEINGSAESSNTSKSDTVSTSDYVKQIIGKNNGDSNIDTFTKLYTDVINIDKMLISELEPLFMGLWE